MQRAYLQNKKAQYYCLGGDGKVALSDNRTALQTIPAILEPEVATIPAGKHHSLPGETRFSFSNDGCRIISYLFFTRGNEADCILTLEQEDSICGNLDFTTARIYGRKEIRINCLHF